MFIEAGIDQHGNRAAIHETFDPPPLVEAEPRRWGISSSLAFCCPGCGSIHARIHMGRRWQFLYRTCRTCRTCVPSADGDIPGSLTSHLETVNAAISGDALRWEFECHLDWFERQMEKYE